MRFSSLTRAVDLTATTCSLQTQAGAPAGQAAQSAVQRSPPSVTHIMGYYSFNWLWRDGGLSWPCWLTDSGCHTHKVVKQPSINLAKDKESPPTRTDVLTIMLRWLVMYDLWVTLWVRKIKQFAFVPRYTSKKCLIKIHQWITEISENKHQNDIFSILSYFLSFWPTINPWPMITPW